jgi:hypothetical protein
MAVIMNVAISTWKQLHGQLEKNLEARRIPLAKPAQRPQPDVVNASREMEIGLLADMHMALENLATRAPGTVDPMTADTILDVSGDYAVRSIAIWIGFHLPNGSSENAFKDCQALAAELSQALTDAGDALLKLSKGHSELLQELATLRAKQHENILKEKAGTRDAVFLEKKDALALAVGPAMHSINLDTVAMIKQVATLVEDVAMGQFQRMQEHYDGLVKLVDYGPKVGGVLLEHWSSSMPGLSSAVGLLVSFGTDKWTMPWLRRREVARKQIAMQKALMVLPLIFFPSAALILADSLMGIEKERVNCEKLAAEALQAVSG